MRVRSPARTCLFRLTHTGTMAASAALVLLAAVIVPAAAPAGQSSQATPAPVAQVAAGVFHSCALVEDGTTPPTSGLPVRCWGFSGNGQVGYGNQDVIGDDETPASVGPVNLGVGRTAKALAVGDYHTCAVLDDGSVRCWGYGNEGQLGYGSRNHVGDDEVPAAVGPVNLGAGRTATAITAGGNHTCALLDNGDIRCWGLGEFGQLGYGSTASIGDGEDPGTAGPVDLGGHSAKAVTAGQSHTCAILDDDSVRCWGIGGNGQLGYANTAAVLDPGTVEAVDIGGTAKAITAGASHTCAVLGDGSVRCWGLNDVGQLGYANNRTIGDNETPADAGPVELGPGRTATAISAGGEHTCVVLDDGSVRCWGSPLFGQLGYGHLDAIGDNETPASVAPVDLGAGAAAAAVAAGIYHTCVRLADGGVRCWGNGADGRLGLCSAADIGDDEVPGSVGRVDLGAGGAACPTAPPPPATPDPVLVPPPPIAPPPAPTPMPMPTLMPTPPLPATSAIDEALRGERLRAQGLRECRAGVVRTARSARTRALRRYRGRRGARALALRQIARRSSRGRSACLRRFGRRPGRVTTLAARPAAGGRIILTFRAPGSNGSSAPAARSYLVKQSLRPIRSALDFKRAPALCKGACTFAVTQVGAPIKLVVTQLRRGRTYYYAVAARDNVSRRAGPRSRTVRAATR